MFGFWKKKYEEMSRKLSEETEIKEMYKRRLSEQRKRADDLMNSQEKAIKALIEDNMTGYVKCGNELLKVCVQSFSGSAGELLEIECVVIKDA